MLYFNVNMDFYKGHLYFSYNKFPMRNKYTTIVGNFTNRLRRGCKLINKEFNVLLKKNMVEEYLENKRNKYFQMLKHLALMKHKKVQSEINKQNRLKLKARIRKSVSNNNMLLNVMSQSKQFQKYLESQKKSRNNNYLMKNSSEKKNNTSSSKTKRSSSYLFMTEVPIFNSGLLIKKKNLNLIKALKDRVFKNSLNIKNKNKKNLSNEDSTKFKSVSVKNIFNTKELSKNLTKRKINIHLLKTNGIKSIFT